MFGNVKSRSPFVVVVVVVVDMNSDDLDAKSKLKLSSFNRSEFSSSFGARMSDASRASLGLGDFDEPLVGFMLL